MTIVLAALGAAEIIAIPTAVLAGIGLVAYFAGAIRPVSVKASYRIDDVGAELGCIVKNRRWRESRSLTGLALVTVPPLRRRLRGWRNRDGGLQASTYLLKGAQMGKLRDAGIVLGAHDQTSVRCRIVDASGGELGSGFRVPDALRVQAAFGGSRAALGRPRLKSLQP